MKIAKSHPMSAGTQLFLVIWRMLGAVTAYVTLSGLMMATNTIILRLGDYKFGEHGWQIYWPIWGVAFSPVLIVGLVSSFIYRSHLQRSTVYLTSVVAVALVAMQISFLIDLQWQGLVVELLVLCFASIMAARKIGRE